MSEQDRAGAAMHEAGHAVVGWALGLPVGEIEIGMGGDDAAGRSEIGDASHLPLIDQIAVCIGGLEAQHLFDRLIHDMAGLSDFGKIIELIEDGISEEQSKELRDAGANRARNLLTKHKDLVARLADEVLKNGKVDAGAFLQAG
jgi:ATP-dependent Zn protease